MVGNGYTDHKGNVLTGSRINVLIVDAG